MTAQSRGKRSADTKRLLDEATRVYYEAKRVHLNTVNAEIRAEPCTRCGNVKGSSCCGNADRVVFPCTNYVEALR